MRDNYLFDYDDKTKHGKGADRLGGEKDGVVLNWKSKHPQVAVAIIGNYKLETVYWYTRYEARLSYYGNAIESDQSEYKTKIEAQIGAEKMFEKFILEGVALLKEMKK